MAAATWPEAVTLGFIGAGRMAESISRGVLRSGLILPSQIRTADPSSDRRDAFASFGVTGFQSNSQVVDKSDVIVLAVKPQIGFPNLVNLRMMPHHLQVRKVVMDLKPHFSKEKLLVSIAAGIKLKDLQEWAGFGRLIRVMPNTPVLIGEGASVMCLGEMVTKDDEELAANLFRAVGKVWTADEKYFDAVTGLSGSGPAYIYLAIEALADGGVAAGLPRDLALGLASQTVLGAAGMLNTGRHPGQLKDDVTSPGGTTIAGIQELEKGAFRGTLMNAVIAATQRSRELSQT
ncbi:hypothetical protein QJS04_geneDACA016626 [Acorus gramineus]|uniref:Pyrroline-5-carboxylate reductase n=1 Tax=Acorus gramineus TaxID=55184 RepID=A0AAV9BNY7_ACOGR|nr:hypothetical protein QJS04_geneDACA016626 [Acorus gramineus]